MLVNEVLLAKIILYEGWTVSSVNISRVFSLRQKTKQLIIPGYVPPTRVVFLGLES